MTSSKRQKCNTLINASGLKASQESAFYLISLANSGSAIGRVVEVVTDRFSVFSSSDYSLLTVLSSDLFS